MMILQAATDAEIAACYPVMQQLRPDLAASEFVELVRQLEKSGYRLVFMKLDEQVVAVAGFRLGKSLAWGRFLYVDDLVTSAQYRSRGCGARLLSWLRAYAIAENCRQLHLDSGIQREDAHRFYQREGLSKASYHFVETLSP